jgi:hypothetical protein
MRAMRLRESSPDFLEELECRFLEWFELDD